jgi:hypothetical protein
MAGDFTRESELQELLVAELKRSTIFVRSEPSQCRFDCAAYVTEKLQIGPAKKPQIACHEKFDRCFCRLLWEAYKDEAEIPAEEREALKAKAAKGLKPGESGYWSSVQNVPGFRLGRKAYKDSTGLWLAVREECKCPEDGDCPTFKDQFERHYATLKEGRYAPGLHLFEIKSDGDNHSRLVHQIPQMMGLADYVWLVLGANQPVPDWLPPFIGILRYDETAKEFRIERFVRLVKREPKRHWQTIDDQGFLGSLPADALSELLRKWVINGLFRWEKGNIILDMTKEISEVLDYIAKLDFQKGIKEKDRDRFNNLLKLTRENIKSRDFEYAFEYLLEATKLREGMHDGDLKIRRLTNLLCHAISLRERAYKRLREQIKEREANGPESVRSGENQSQDCQS